MSQVDELERDDAVAEEQPLAWWQRVATGSSTFIGLILVGLIVVFTLINTNDFLSVANIRNIATDASVLLIMATGMTYVIVTAGIDLSIGSVLVFAGVVGAKVMNAVGGNGTGVIVLGLIVALAAGLAWGLINGFLVSKANIPAFIVTLGTFGIALGAAELVTGGVDEREVPTKLITGIGTGRLFGIPWLVVIAAGVCLVFGIILGQTRFGRYTYAVGSSAEGVRRAGVSVDAHLIKVYTLMGGLAGVAGFLNLARFGTTTIAGHATDNLGGGKAAADTLAKLIGGKGKVFVNNVNPGISTTDLRAKGFADEAKKLGLTYIGQQFNGDDPAKAASIVNGILAKNPDLKGIFATNLFGAEGSATALRQSGKLGKVKIVGFDAGPKQVADLKSGLVQGLIAQKPATIGADGVQQAYNALSGKPVTKKIATGFVSMTKANLGTTGQYAYKSHC